MYDSILLVYFALKFDYNHGSTVLAQNLEYLTKSIHEKQINNRLMPRGKVPWNLMDWQDRAWWITVFTVTPGYSDKPSPQIFFYYNSPKSGDSVCRLGASWAGGLRSLVTRPPPLSLWYSIRSLMVENLCFSEMKYFWVSSCLMW